MSSPEGYRWVRVNCVAAGSREVPKDHCLGQRHIRPGIFFQRFSYPTYIEPKIKVSLQRFVAAGINQFSALLVADHSRHSLLIQKANVESINCTAIKQ